MDTSSMTDEDVGAWRYILHMLLQRLEATHPGLTEGMLEGARGDRADVVAQGGPVPVFDAAIAMLEMIHAHNGMAAGS